MDSNIKSSIMSENILTNRTHTTNVIIFPLLYEYNKQPNFKHIHFDLFYFPRKPNNSKSSYLSIVKFL